MVCSRMNREIAVDVSFAVGAQIVAIWFLRTYSKVVFLHLPHVVDHVYLAVIHRLFLNHWHTTLIVPCLTVVLGVVLARMDRPIGVRILCQFSWLFALALVCVSVVVWEFAYVHTVRLYD